MECWYSEGRSNEIVETISRRKIDICCIQEVRRRGASTRLIKGKDTVKNSSGLAMIRDQMVLEYF